MTIANKLENTSAAVDMTGQPISTASAILGLTLMVIRDSCFCVFER
ncbi:MAG TPA: hypothetical protein VIP70_05155 [Nitrososphaeraceae archaeon]